MPSVGSITVDILRGLPDKAGETGQDITRPGVDGVAVRKAGARSMPVQIETTEFIAAGTSGADLDTRIAAYKALQMTLVTLTDGFGVETANVLVRAVDVQRRRVADVDGAVASAPDTMLTARWTVQDTNISE